VRGRKRRSRNDVPSKASTIGYVPLILHPFPDMCTEKCKLKRAMSEEEIDHVLQMTMSGSMTLSDVVSEVMLDVSRDWIAFINRNSGGKAGGSLLSGAKIILPSDQVFNTPLNAKIIPNFQLRCLI